MAKPTNRYFEDEARLFLKRYIAPLVFEEDIDKITSELYDIFVNSQNAQEWAEDFCKELGYEMPI